jgi:transcriptional regulator with XRE-family HTH domain
MSDRAAWLRDERRKRNMTQQNLAEHCKVKLRTVQRAEKGLSMSERTWAAFETQLGAFNLARRSKHRTDRYRQFRPLRRMKSAREFLEALGRASVVKIECDVEPTKEVFPILERSISFLEDRFPDPWNLARQKYQPKTLLERVKDEAALNDLGEELNAVGAGLYYELQWGHVLYPQEDYRGDLMAGSEAEGHFLMQVVISASTKERDSFPEVQNWGLQLVGDPFDDEVPF